MVPSTLCTMPMVIHTGIASGAHPSPTTDYQEPGDAINIQTTSMRTPRIIDQRFYQLLPPCNVYVQKPHPDVAVRRLRTLRALG